jgi:ADP-heptose:LPS heptosyltransferase
MKTALIVRVGGLGDCLILTVVARELAKKDYLVDYAVGSPTGNLSELFTKLPYFNKVFQVNRLNGIDCIEDESKNVVSVELLKDSYDEVFDFKYSVEDNVTGLNKREEWRATINSNFQNWIDLSLSWANIDPTQVKNKRPEFQYPDFTDNVPGVSKYEIWVETETPIRWKKDRGHRVIGIQLNASSLTRSWYRSADLPKMLHEKYPNDIVCIFAGDKWVALTENGNVEIRTPDGYNPILCSATLIANMDVFIAADSGMSHIAEATGTPTIGVYTTVPSWTRVKDYLFAHPIDATVPCHPCFNLDIFCPLEKKKAKESISEREKDILAGSDANANINDFAKKYNTVPKAIFEEFEAINKRIQAMSAVEPACVHSITSELIMNKVEEILCKTTDIQQ